jgi:hypothetical protein
MIGTEPVELRNAHLQVFVDPGLGADVVGLVDRRTAVDVLFRTPWRDRADAVRAGQRPSAEPGAAWLEQYRGGWQTLCPVAGDPQVVHGAPVGFHGEAARVPWRVHDATRTELSLSVELFSVPLRIERLVRVTGPRVVVADSVRNLSPVPLRVDYVHHPAFGGAFVDGPLRFETNARTFTPDARTVDSAPADLTDVPPPGEPREVFGWLSDFDGTQDPWCRLVNPALHLAAEVSWTGLPYAWLWQELEHTTGFPWYRRARAIAIEPASVPTSGPARHSEFTVAGRSHRELTVTVELQERS